MNRPIGKACGDKGKRCLLFSRVVLESTGQMVILRDIQLNSIAL